jgi:YebC/PmpR family DNA-binding regulatory protein
MAGHSHWKQIQHKKGAADQKRGQLFSKLLNAISAAARHELNPQFNPRLRATIDKARDHGVPQENIERAIQRANGDGDQLQEIIMEAYGPGGTALIIEGITDNQNRLIAEMKNILKKHQAKRAEPGSVRWAFTRSDENPEWQPKFVQELNNEDKQKLEKLIQELENHDGVQKVYHNSRH